MRGQETYCVISGPMKGLTKTASDGVNTQTNRQTDGHGDSMTDLAQRAESLKINTLSVTYK